jgi:ribosomal protein L29
MAKSKSAADAVDHTHDELVKEIAALKKEVADLKKELAKSKGGADPRVDKIISVLKTINGEKIWKNNGL